LDLSKAFDCLDYDKLFYKMENLGFDINTLKWFRSYLSERKQRTEVEGTLSDTLDMELGVPQGSILGPILFLIYVNDVKNSDLTAEYSLYADDTTVIQSAPTLREATDKMNSTMSKVHEWFTQNKLNLNPSKTRYMIFNGKGTAETKLVKIDDEYIERVWTYGKEKSFKLVGIQVDEKLKWNEHITYIAKKIGYANYSLTKAQKKLSVKSKKLLYSGLIHSHLVYGSPVWGFAAKCRLDKLIKQQKKAIRKIYNLRYKDHTHEFFSKAKILKLQDLLEHTTLCYMQSGLHETSPNHVKRLWQIKSQPREALRDQGVKIHYKLTKKEWINQLAPIAQAKLWNNCKLDKSCKPNAFKNKSKNTILKQYNPDAELVEYAD